MSHRKHSNDDNVSGNENAKGEQEPAGDTAKFEGVVVGDDELIMRISKSVCHLGAPHPFRVRFPHLPMTYKTSHIIH